MSAPINLQSLTDIPLASNPGTARIVVYTSSGAVQYTTGNALAASAGAAAEVFADAAEASAEEAAESAALAETAGATAGAEAGAEAVAALNVATIAALRALSITGLTSGYGVTVRCYAAEHDGGGGIYILNTTSTTADNAGTVIRPDSLTSIQAGRWLRVMFGLNPTPQMFGAKCNGTDDDSPAIKACSDASRIVWFPAVSYTIKTKLVISTPVSHWVGLGGHYPGSTTLPGPRLVYHSDLGSDPMIENQVNTVFTNIAFKGPAKGTGTAIVNRRVPGDIAYEDTDVAIFGCNFTEWNRAVEHWNRGLHFFANTVGACTNAVRLYWDDANFLDDSGNPYDGLPEGWRAIRIDDNRFHLLTLAVANTETDNEYLRGFHMCDNTLDAGDRLFLGGLYSGTISDNIIDQINDTAIEFTSDVKDVTISGNTIAGDVSPRTEPDELIAFREEVSNFTITGNTLRNAADFGIVFSKAVTGGSISGNSISEIGTAGDATAACIRFIANASDVAISGNYFKPRTDARAIRGTTSATWAGMTIQGNTRDRTQAWVTSYTDGGNNSIQS